jgi:tetrahydromethanopterin S-methyltransferase subunit G
MMDDQIAKRLDSIERKLDILIAALAADDEIELGYDMDGNLIPPDRNENAEL